MATGAILAQTCEVRVGDVLGHYEDDRIAAPPGTLAVRVEHDAVRRRVGLREPGFSPSSAGPCVPDKRPV